MLRTLHSQIIPGQDYEQIICGYIIVWLMSLFTKQVTWVQIPVVTYQMLMCPEPGEGGGLQNR